MAKGQKVDKHDDHVRRITPRGPRQEKYLDRIINGDIVFGVGPAGTGKTFLSVVGGLRALQNRQVSRIVITRPVVEAGEKLGFLPGDLYEKINPYLKPVYDAFFSLIGPERLIEWRDQEIIEIVPLAYMRGRSLEGAYILLDEAQNTTPEQMKMFLTRMGKGSKLVVTGDPTQTDLPSKMQSGLSEAIRILKKVEEIDFIYFEEADVVRHELVKKIVHAYAEDDEKKSGPKVGFCG